MYTICGNIGGDFNLAVILIWRFGKHFKIFQIKYALFVLHARISYHSWQCEMCFLCKSPYARPANNSM